MPTKVSRPGCDIEDVCYIPSDIVVEKGGSVTWLNEDSSFHTVTSGFYGEPTDKEITLIAKYCKNLESLYLIDGDKISDNAFCSKKLADVPK